MGATCSRHEPRSHHFARLLEVDARGRSDLHSPKTHGRPKRIASPKQCKIGAAGTQRRRLSVRTASLASPRLAATDCSGLRRSRERRCWPLGCGLRHRQSTYARLNHVLPGPGVRQAPIMRPEREGADSEASSEAAGRRERTTLMVGHGDAGPSSLHAGSAWVTHATALGAADAAIG